MGPGVSLLLLTPTTRMLGRSCAMASPMTSAGVPILNQAGNFDTASGRYAEILRTRGRWIEKAHSLGCAAGMNDVQRTVKSFGE